METEGFRCLQLFQTACTRLSMDFHAFSESEHFCKQLHELSLYALKDCSIEGMRSKWEKESHPCVCAVVEGNRANHSIVP